MPSPHLSDRTRTVRGLVHDLARALDQHLRSLTSQFDLTLTQAAALRELGQPLTQRELASRLCCEPSNVTFVIDKLEGRALIHRAAHPTDRRVNLLVLTDAGAETRTRLLSAMHDDGPLAHLSDAELEDLERALTRALRAPGSSSCSASAADAREARGKAGS